MYWSVAQNMWYYILSKDGLNKIINITNFDDMLHENEKYYFKEKTESGITIWLQKKWQECAYINRSETDVITVVPDILASDVYFGSIIISLPKNNKDVNELLLITSNNYTNNYTNANSESNGHNINSMEDNDDDAEDAEFTKEDAASESEFCYGDSDSSESSY